jgi:hypothetical protein
LNRVVLETTDSIVTTTDSHALQKIAGMGTREIRDICKGCDTLQLIQNKTLYLCPDCVFKKNHQGKSKVEVYKERHDKRHKELKPVTIDLPSKEALLEGLKAKFTIKKISNKRAERHAARNRAYKQIDTEREPICEGCGLAGIPLSHSHLLSEQQRPDLYGNKDNIRLHCFGTYRSCHETWERGLIYEVVLMVDFKENLEFVKLVDQGEYNKIVANAIFHNVKI